MAIRKVWSLPFFEICDMLAAYFDMPGNLLPGFYMKKKDIQYGIGV